MAGVHIGERQPEACLEAVLIELKDPEALADFYCRAFDLEPPRNYGPDHLGMDLANTYLGFDCSNEASGEAPPRIQLWFRVGDMKNRQERLCLPVMYISRWD